MCGCGEKVLEGMCNGVNEFVLNGEWQLEKRKFSAKFTEWRGKFLWQCESQKRA